MPNPLLEQWNLNRNFLKKSCTQVETLVGPLVAPPKSRGLKPGRKRASPVKVRLDASEKEIVKRKAKRVGLSVNAFIKCVALGSDYDPHLRSLYLMLNRELTAQGRNLNQVAKHLNASLATPTQGAEMIEAIRGVWLQTLYAVRNALAHNRPQP